MWARKLKADDLISKPKPKRHEATLIEHMAYGQSGAINESQSRLACGALTPPGIEAVQLTNPE